MEITYDPITKELKVEGMDPEGLNPNGVYLETSSSRQYLGSTIMDIGLLIPQDSESNEKYTLTLVELKEAELLYKKIKESYLDEDQNKRTVISLYGGSGSGKSTIAEALELLMNADGVGCFVLTGDNYPHRIPMRNDEERMRVYEADGEDGLRNYLGTSQELDFDDINKVLADFHAGKDVLNLKHMGRTDGDISYEETDITGIDVMLLEWTHGGSDDLIGVDVPIYIEVSPEVARERRIKRGRDENAASPFIAKVIELEQEKLERQKNNAKLIVGKDGKIYEQ